MVSRGQEGWTQVGGWRWAAWCSKVVWLLQWAVWALVALGEAAFPHWSSGTWFQLQALPSPSPLVVLGEPMLGAGSWMNKKMQQLIDERESFSSCSMFNQICRASGHSWRKVVSVCNKRKVCLSRGAKPDNEVILSRCILL